MGGPSCSIAKCSANKTTHRGLSFHKIPAKGTNDGWRKLLLDIINRQIFENDPTKFNPDSAHICSRHFKESCFKFGPRGKKRILIEGSLPTEHMPVAPVDQSSGPSESSLLHSAVSVPLASTSTSLSVPQTEERLMAEVEPSPQGSLEDSSRPEVKSEFRPSFLRSPAYVHWQRVGEQHGLHENEDIACFLLKYYEDTSKVFPSGLTVCSTCGRPLCVSCPHCKWTASTEGHPGQQASESGDAVTMKEEGVDHDDNDDDCGEQSGLPSSSSGPLSGVQGSEAAESEGDQTEAAEKRGSENSDTGHWEKLESGWLEKGEVRASQELVKNWSEKREDDDSDDGLADEQEETVDSMDEAAEIKVEKDIAVEPEMGSSCKEESAAAGSRLDQSKQKFPSDSRRGAGSGQRSSSDKTTLLAASKPFECDVCGKTFQRAGSLRRHKTTHSGKKCYTCDICSKAFSRKFDLKRHQLLHTGPKPSTCDSNSELSTDNADMESLSCNVSMIPLTSSTGPTPVMCITDPEALTCSTETEPLTFKTEPGELPFNTDLELSTHGSGKKSLTCSVCGESFDSAHALKLHRAVQHAGLKPFLCDVCGKRWERKGDFNKHKMIHFRDKKSFVCEICNKAFWTAAELKIHKMLHSGHKPFMCDICGKAFFRAYLLRKHQKVHSEDKSFTCDVCKAVFSSLASLREHRASHIEKKPFACDMCSKSYAQPRHLWQHKRIHSGVKSFACDVCGKTFYFASALKYHKETHSDIRPFMCDICCKTFRREDHLKIHKSRHAGTFKKTPANNKPVTCKVCNKVFKHPNSLWMHKVIHTGQKPYVCDVCNKAFRFAPNLKRHKLIHTGEKPFECDVCNKTFRQKVQLEAHTRTHTGVKPYMCDVCSKRFTDLGSMRKHKKIHLRNS